MVTRESERSCDEENVASLGCQPATYARGLLEVLEHQLEGEARVQMDELKISAEKIEFGVDGETIKLAIHGDAIATTDEFDVRAQLIEFGMDETAITVLEGNARLIRIEPKTDIRADLIQWNTETDEINATNAKTTTSAGK